MEKTVFLIENPELLRCCIVAMAVVIWATDLSIKKYLKNRRKKENYTLLKRRFEYFRY